MKIEVVEATKSTAEHPLWVWRVWRGGRAADAGISSNQQEAKHAAEAAMQRLLEGPFQPVAPAADDTVNTKMDSDEQDILNWLKSDG